DRAALHFAVLDQLVHDVTGEVARDREANSLIAARLTEDRCIDSDQFSARVNQRPARVAWIDCRVGLNEVFVGGEPLLEPTAGGADNSQRDRLIQLKWIA